jgi:uncharacterized protein (TIGR03435 family)
VVHRRPTGWSGISLLHSREEADVRRFSARSLVSIAAVVIWALGALCVVDAQKEVAFEVASVKESHAGGGAQTFSITPDGSYRLTNATARMFIRQAYRLQDFQIVGAPSWTDADRFDVTAQSPSGVGVAAVPGMLQTLLRDRFALVVHKEIREMPIYALVLDRANGTLGPHIARTPSAASVECAEQRSSRTAPDRSDGKPCGIGIRGGSITAGDATLSQLLGLLSPMVGRTTVDRTQLVGTFDYTLNWTPDDFQDRTASPDRERPLDPNGLSIFTAIQEQLGLKLESTRGPVDVLVIDRVGKPSPD